jgi:hypothetical protein
MPSPRLVTPISKHLGTELTKAWYVAFSQGHVTTMRIVKHRIEAITLACNMLDRGIEVTGAGPMLEPEERKLDQVSIRQIWRARHGLSGERPIDPVTPERPAP